jgi:hypothetical protein
LPKPIKGGILPRNRRVSGECRLKLAGLALWPISKGF